MASARTEQVFIAWILLLLVMIWSYLWKAIAFWKAARRDHVGWYVFLALAPPFGLLEMIYVFWIAPHHPELDQQSL